MDSKEMPDKALLKDQTRPSVGTFLSLTHRRSDTGSKRGSCQHPIFAQAWSVKNPGIMSTKDKILKSRHAQRHLRTA